MVALVVVLVVVEQADFKGPNTTAEGDYVILSLQTVRVAMFLRSVCYFYPPRILPHGSCGYPPAIGR